MNKAYDAESFWERRLASCFDLTNAGFVSLGPRYNTRLYEARLRALERALAAENRSLAGMRVLEVGCGTGFYTDYFARSEVDSYVGVDITSVSVTTLSRKHPDYGFHKIDVAKQGVRVGSDFDVVLAADVLFHIVDETGFRTAMQSLSRATKSNGLLIVSDIFPPHSVSTNYYCHHRGINEYEMLLRTHGFKILRIEPIFAILQPPPLLPGSSFSWRAYAHAWRLGWRMASFPMIDSALPTMLSWLDEHFFLPRLGPTAPNNKWLVAAKALEAPLC